MPGRMRLAGPAVMLALAATAVGCGDDDGGALIPPDSAEAMLRTAQEIEDAIAEQACESAQGLTTELRGQVEALPEETDPEIVDALDQMVSRVDEQLDSQCVEEGTTDTEEATEPTETTVAPEPTTSVPTETTTTTEPPPEEEEEAPPEEPPGGGPPATPPGQAGGAPPTGGTEGDD